MANPSAGVARKTQLLIWGVAGCVVSAAFGCGTDKPLSASKSARPSTRSASGGPIEDVETGTARPAGAKLTMGGFSDGCTLLTDAEIKAILPQAQRITRDHQFQKSDCSYQITFPWYNEPGVQLGDIVRWWSANKSEAVSYLARMRKTASGFRGPRRKDAARLGADECYDDEHIVVGAPEQITCRKGGVVFSADAAGFLFVKGSSHDNKQKERAWYDRVVLEMVKTITAKLDVTS